LKRDEDGAAPLESIFAIVFLMLLALGTIQIAYALYARNVIAASAHEGARAAVEFGRDPADAESVARRVIAGSAGNLVTDLDIDLTLSSADELRVTVSARVKAWGPIPIPIRLTSTATSTRFSPDR
jgi:Flp pilus assembly protein TadG